MLEAAQLGNVATRLLFENERVKVWEMRLEPGESSDLHRHTLDYLLYILEGTSIDADRPDGESLRFPVEPGHLFFVPRGGPDRAANRSGTRCRALAGALKHAEARTSRTTSVVKRSTARSSGSKASPAMSPRSRAPTCAAVAPVACAMGTCCTHS